MPRLYIVFVRMYIFSDMPFVRNRRKPLSSTVVFPKLIKLLLDTKTKIKESPCGRVWLCDKISTCIEFFTGPLKTKHFVKLPYLWDTILSWPFLTDSSCSDIQIQVAPFTIYAFYYLIDHVFSRIISLRYIPHYKID